MNTKYIGSKIIACDLFLSCAASTPLAKPDFAGLRPHPGRLSLRRFRRDCLHYRIASALHSTDLPLSVCAGARASKSPQLPSGHLEMPDRRHAALCLENVSRSLAVPSGRAGPLTANYLTFRIDLQCGPRDPQKQPVLDDTGDGLDDRGEL